jgi:sugar phosphate isomerase/epimerase
VKWPAFFQTLRRIGFQGHLAIEREAGNQRLADIATAKKVVERMA